MKQNKGTSQILVMVFMVVLAVALPVLTKFALKSQEDRIEAYSVCTEDDWISTISPTVCPSTAQQTKIWTKIGTCIDGISHPDSETVTCIYVPPVTEKKLRFEVSFMGVKPGAKCVDDFAKSIRVNLINRLTTVSEDAVSMLAIVFNDGNVPKTNINGEQVFSTWTDGGISLLPFTFRNFEDVGVDNVVRVKGYRHAQMRYCVNNQKNRMFGDSPCNISLTNGIVYNFSDYPILAGDVDVDGVINVLDFSNVKTRLDPDAEPVCEKEGDLNGDGVVNNLDIGLIKIALSYRDDE